MSSGVGVAPICKTICGRRPRADELAMPETVIAERYRFLGAMATFRCGHAVSRDEQGSTGAVWDGPVNIESPSVGHSLDYIDSHMLLPP